MTEPVLSRVTPFLQAAFHYLAAKCGEDGKAAMIVPETAAWARVGRDRFELRPKAEPCWWSAISRELGSFTSLPEYGSCVAALAEDALFGTYLHRRVGTALWHSILLPEHLVQSLLYHVVQRTPQLTFDEGSAVTALGELRRPFEQPNVQVRLDFPLVGLSADETSIYLGGYSSISEMADIELQECLELGLFDASHFRFAGQADIASQRALIVYYDEPKWIGEAVGATTSPTPREIDGAEERLKVALERVSEIQQALLVFKDGEVRIPGALYFDPFRIGYVRARAIHLGAPASAASATYHLNQSEAEAFKMFLPVFRQVTATHGGIAASARRLAYAGDRDRADDAFLDLVIAAEALFTGEGDRGEFTFKVALRTALFSRSADYTPDQLFRFMMRAYKIRSVIAHGGKPKDKDIKDFTGEEVDLETARGLLRRIVGGGLRQAVLWLNEGKVLDWDALALQG